MKHNLITSVDRTKEELIQLAKAIWEHPEVSDEEYFAVEMQKAYLEQKGLSITLVEEMPTAFVAEFGEGEPCIGILGEYDALSGFSQQVSIRKEPAQENGAGHACGHNLLGVGSLGAVVAIKEVMEAEGIRGSIKYFGCPAEECGIGKIKMYEKGCFKGLDCALSWHPFDINATWRCRCQAYLSVRFNFIGEQSLQGAVLMNVGVNYLKAHIQEDIHLHYTITNGGENPYIPVGTTQTWYCIRGRTVDDVEDVFRKIMKIARDAKCISETDMTYEVIDGEYDYLPNHTLTTLLGEQLTALGAPHYSEEDITFAQALAESLAQEERVSVALQFQGNKSVARYVVHQDVVDDITYKACYVSGSTDTSDVSHIVPTAQVVLAAWPVGTPAHTWQACAASGSGMGFAAMIHAAKVLGSASYELLTCEKYLQKAKVEFQSVLKGFTYKPLKERS